MEKKYLELWKLAKPYYQKGRSYDVPHIEWMMGQADNLLKVENFDREILMPLVILHDIGYSEVGERNPNVKDQNTKKIHMEKGSEISERLLADLGFNTEIVKKVSYLVSVHDNWVFGDSKVFHDIPEMAAFNDLDFIYPFNSFEQFKTNAESMGMNPGEAYVFWKKDEKLTQRPLCCNYTKKLFEKLKKDIEANIKKA